MTDPINLGVKLVNALLSRVKDVKTNKEGCQLLTKLAQQTLRILQSFEEQPLEPSLQNALESLTDALKEAQDAIDQCWQANFFSTMLHRERYSSSLKNAAAKIEHALFQIPIASLGTNTDIKSSICDLFYQLRHAKFEERAALSKQVVELKEVLELSFNQARKGTEEVKQLIRGLMQKHLMMREELKMQIDLLVQEASRAKKNKEGQLEFELDEIIAAVSESLKDVPKPHRHNEELKNCTICPITKDIMKDPVIVMESGKTYDRSSIQEWFDRGHHTDPLTNKKLQSIELIPDCSLQDICFDYLNLNRSSNSKLKRPPLEKPKLMLEPGLYEGHGKLIIGLESILIFQTLILQPLGKLFGYTMYKRENCRIEEFKMEFGEGEWDGTTFHLSYKDNCYIYNGSVNPELNQKIKFIGKIVAIKNTTKGNDFHLCYYAPSIRYSTWPRPGVFQVEGITYPIEKSYGQITKIILSLRVDWNVEGWIWIKDSVQSSNVVGRIIKGCWNSSGRLVLNVTFPLETISVKLESMLKNYSMVFEVYNKVGQTKTTFPSSFNVNCIEEVNEGKITKNKASLMCLDDLKTMENLCIHEASIPWHHLCQELLGAFSKGFQVSKDVNLLSMRTTNRTCLNVNYGLIPYNKYTWKRTLLHIKSINNFIDDIKELIANGVDIDYKDSNGETSLHLALHNNSIDVFEELIAKKAKTHIRRKDGSYPLHLAAQHESTKAIKKLIPIAENLNLQNKDGWTPLHVAACNNSINVAKELIMSGADFYQVDNDGQTSLHVAAKVNSIDVAKV